MTSESVNGPGRRLGSLKEVARALDVSTSTVSRALNDHPSINRETRERVLAFAEQHGFRLNATARSLRRRRTDAVAFILSPPQTAYANGLYLALIGGMHEELRGLGRLLLVTSAADADDELAILRHLVQGGHVDAVAFGRVRVEDPRIDFLLDARFPFATLAGGGPTLPYPSVDLDHGLFARLAFRRLHDFGHRRIALVTGPADYLYCRAAIDGFRSAADEVGLPARIQHADLTEEGGLSAAIALLDAPEPPTGLVCINDVIAYGAYRAIEQRGMVVGRTVSVIGANNLVGSGYLSPPLTTFMMPARQAGRRIAHRIVARLEESEGALYATESFGPELVARASDGPPQPD